MADVDTRLAKSKAQAKSHVQKHELTAAAVLLEELTGQYPADIETWEMLAFIHDRLGNSGRLIKAFRQLLALQPGNFNACSNLGLALLGNGELSEAIACYRKAIQIDNNNADAFYNLALALQKNGEPGEAIPYYRQALRIRPNWPEALNNLSLTLRATGNLNDAINLLEEFVAAYPSTIKLLYLLAETYDEDCQFTKALHTYHDALNLDPANATTLSRIAGILLNQGKIDSALDYSRRALQLEPGNTDFQAGLIDIYESTGNYTEACSHLLPLLENKPVPIKIALKFASLCHHLDKCTEATELLVSRLEDKDPSVADKRQIHFALGKLLDSEKRYGSAFSHFQQANALVKYNFDAARFSSLIQVLINAFSVENMPLLPRVTGKTDCPALVFIVGMPRSGTSLVEQIIATHSKVFGAGELDIIPRFVASLGSKMSYPQSPSSLNRETLERFSGHYREVTGKLHDKEARLVTDKMPENFLHLGLIEMLFPDAKIIHCTRDPLDTCLSCYFQEFRGTHHYAYKLPDLGAYYRQYQRVMAHWSRVLTLPIIEVRYEEMVKNTEAVSRSIFGFLGLEWEEQCLKFYHSRRFVGTASRQQVKKPIYPDSVGRWKNYEPYLGPLKSALDNGN